LIVDPAQPNDWAALSNQTKEVKMPAKIDYEIAEQVMGWTKGTWFDQDSGTWHTGWFEKGKRVYNVDMINGIPRLFWRPTIYCDQALEALDKRWNIVIKRMTQPGMRSWAVTLGYLGIVVQDEGVTFARTLSKAILKMHKELVRDGKDKD